MTKKVVVTLKEDDVSWLCSKYDYGNIGINGRVLLVVHIFKNHKGDVIRLKGLGTML